MRRKTAKDILKNVKKTYSTIAEDFSGTRKMDWAEFELILPYISDGDKVADIGCGNGRFYKFINSKKKIKYIGIDNRSKTPKQSRVQRRRPLENPTSSKNTKRNSLHRSTSPHPFEKTQRKSSQRTSTHNQIRRHYSNYSLEPTQTEKIQKTGCKSSSEMAIFIGQIRKKRTFHSMGQ